MRSILNAVQTGIISTPPPIVTRVFQEINSGMLALAEMQTISETPFPVPYSTMISWLLKVHMILTPFFAVSLTNARIWAFLFAYTTVFSLWAVHYISLQLENPFGKGQDDLDFPAAQRE